MDTTATPGIGADSLRAGPFRDAATRGTTADREMAPRGPWHRQPRWVMLRSVLVPGWGQWTNRRPLKALVVAAGEGYLLYRAIDYGRLERERGRLAKLESDPAQRERLLEKKRYAGSRRRDFTWWTIFAAVLSMGDAYVDAQLGEFDPEFRPQDEETPAGRSLNWRLALSRSWP